MRESIVNIQSATAVIRGGKKKKERKKKQDKNIMSTSATQGGHNYPIGYAFTATIQQFSGTIERSK